MDLNGERVFAVHHRPNQSASRAIVLCHPLGEEKLWAHRVFVTLARDLAAAGFAVLRFDFRGEGDSDRQFERSDFETRIEDTCLAIDTVRELNPSVTAVTLLGLRFGASVAAAAAIRRSEVSQLILWDPMVNGAAYMQTVLRLNLMFQMARYQRVVENRDALVARLAKGETVNIEGYELAEPLYQQVSEFRLEDVLAKFTGSTLAVAINQVQTPVKAELTALAEIIDRCDLVQVQEEPFWKEIKAFYQRAPELTRVSLQALKATS
jgi:exosortase A-associated hydrolase 2